MTSVLVSRALAATIASQLAVALLSPAAPAIAGQPDPGQPATIEAIELQIRDLHDRLHITMAEEAQWSAVAQIMRDNARTMDGLVRQRARDARAMTAIEDLRSFRAIADADAAALDRLEPSFAVLYAAMPDPQKRNADRVFGHHRPQAAAPQ